MNCKKLKLEVPSPEFGGLSLNPILLTAWQQAGNIPFFTFECGIYFIDQLLSKTTLEDRRIVKYSRQFWVWWYLEFIDFDSRFSLKDCQTYYKEAHRIVHLNSVLRKSFWDNIPAFVADGERFILEGGAR